MFVLHVALKIKAGESPSVEKVFHGPFKAAIAAQPGFKSVSLLRPQDDGDYLLSIAFESQHLQQKWVATDLHKQVWAMIESHLDGYALRPFRVV